ncbi:hypothetical protein J6A31_00965 [bacterium]|nr:hypothetical protein [bacterium]
MSIDLSKAEDFGAIIKQKRIDVFHLSQEDFAERFGVNVATLRNWEQRISQPPQYFMQLIYLQEQVMNTANMTPVELDREHSRSIVESNADLKSRSETAYRSMNKNEAQRKVLATAKDIIHADGVLERLQKISPYFNDYSATDVSAICQVALLRDISEKLSTIIERLDAKI